MCKIPFGYNLLLGIPATSLTLRKLDFILPHISLYIYAYIYINCISFVFHGLHIAGTLGWGPPWSLLLLWDNTLPSLLIPLIPLRSPQLPSQTADSRKLGESLPPTSNAQPRRLCLTLCGGPSPSDPKWTSPASGDPCLLLPRPSLGGGICWVSALERTLVSYPLPDGVCRLPGSTRGHSGSQRPIAWREAALSHRLELCSEWRDTQQPRTLN